MLSLNSFGGFMGCGLLLLGFLAVMGPVYPQIPFTSSYPVVPTPNPAPVPSFYGPNYYEPADAEELKEEKEARKKQMQNEKEIMVIEKTGSR